jgi:hypothetical protein
MHHNPLGGFAGPRCVSISQGRHSRLKNEPAGSSGQTSLLQDLRVFLEMGQRRNLLRYPIQCALAAQAGLLPVSKTTTGQSLAADNTFAFFQAFEQQLELLDLGGQLLRRPQDSASGETPLAGCRAIRSATWRR